jgi:hypothetical protein
VRDVGSHRAKRSQSTQLSPQLYETGAHLMSDEERAYFYRRAEEEVERAQSSAETAATVFHYQLSELYLERVFGCEQAATA